MDTDTCVGYVTRGPNRGLRCTRPGVHPLGWGTVHKYKVCSKHYTRVLSFANQGYVYPVWMEDLLNRALKGRYDHA